MDRIELVNAYREILKENIEYDCMVSRYGKERLDGTMELMLEVVLSKRPFIRIAGDDFPRKVVKGHSLSVSDVVILHGNDAYYVDSIGFKELPDFFGAGAPEAKRDVSVQGQLDNARKQAAQAGLKAPDKKPREPEGS